MGLTFNGKTPESITIGGKAVASLSINGDVVWPEQPTGPDYFYIENVDEDGQGENLVAVAKYGSPSTGSDLSYSLDGDNWNLCEFESGICIIYGLWDYGDKVYFRSSTGFSESDSKYYMFGADYPHSVGGDIRTLFNYQNINSITNVNCPKLFYYDATLIDASNLDCSRVETICYPDAYSPPYYYYSWNQAFSGCDSLISPPIFRNLKTIWYLGAHNMFRDCVSLTSPVDLSSVTSVKYRSSGVTQYSGLNSFYKGCSSLSNIIAPNVSTWSSDSSNGYIAYDWVSGVNSTGTMHCPAGLSISTGKHGIPSGWTRVDY